MSLAIGVIGAGVMGRAHTRIIEQGVTGARVAMISDPDEARARDAARGADGAVVALDPARLIASDEVDAVLVASPDHTHAAYVAACLRMGKPVLCEKPLAETAAACLDLVALERKLGRRLAQVGFMRRFDPAYVDLKAVYDSGAVGPARLIRCIHRNAVAPGFFVGDMAISNAMVHEFDVVRWLTGAELRRVRVSAPPVQDGSGPGDPLLATLETDGGQLVDIEVFMNARYGYDIRTEILGPDGAIEMAGRATTVRRLAGGEAFPHHGDFTHRFADAYRLQLQDWVDALRRGEGTGSGATIWDGYVAVQVAEAAVQALQSQDWVEVRLAQAEQGVPRSDEAGQRRSEVA
ncbi:Gfo/Idh/MocA family oxidoreductase [Rubellimicrobium arenae]|uniref:Gfo/Idh/MocA family oxidoreductase n=1 Tax=Rubellimicrobium arenae TaxID=2817372 RepID=UPI001B312231|nr:Gfo/Idh/MocA family oxidoreductase [Rubellimicrobium arenae]